ncbi:hypothetical protein V1525DRAFT_335125 [Lipomyces kononenkoae]|uniref:Uncharacterized protein n=1 Tax=Lipomyces kononenkoae TaxID=34357 RepID=A0ACC3TB41_LIPKO
MVVSKPLAAFDDRIASFRVHRVGNGTKRGAVKAWPHTRPSVTQMAKAGFIYNPSPQSPDNVTCFLCDKSLDGWNKGDDPKIEHLDHSPQCAWAIIHGSDWKDDEYHDPQGSDMERARLETFGNWWPHDGKRGWIPTSQNMSKAGFFYNPGRAGDDFAACMYCGVVLDGWEPKDDPTEEHRRRGPDCYFFTRIHRGSSKAKRNSRARHSTSAASKKASPRKRPSSGMDLEEESQVEEPKPKRRANKRNSKASPLSTTEDSTRELNYSNTSQTSQQRRLSARQAASREITLSSVPTDSIAEVEEEPETSVKRTRGPRPMKTKVAKTKNTRQGTSPKVETAPPLPPLQQILTNEVLKKYSSPQTSMQSRRSSRSENSSSLLEDLIANYSETHEESLNAVTARAKPDSPEDVHSQSTPAAKLNPDQVPRPLERQPSHKVTPKSPISVIPGSLTRSRKYASAVRTTAEDTSTTGSRNRPTHSENTPTSATPSRNVSTESTTISPSHSVPGTANGDGRPHPIDGGTAASSPREKLASRTVNQNSSPRVLTDSPHSGNVIPVSRDLSRNKLNWSRNSLSRYVDEQNDAKMLLSSVFEGQDISEMDLDMTVEECIRRMAEMGERTLLMKCDRLVGILEREGERAINLLESCSS